MENTVTFAISALMWVISIAIAAVAIWMNRVSERENRANHEKVLEALAAIDSSVSKTQKHILDTVTDVLREPTVPPKDDFDQLVKIMLLQVLIDDPEKFMKIMAVIRNQRNN